MKISKLHIDQFRHLENLDFDFTYPEDFHIEEKRGKPLDKICFIGQSATGKTSLLELIFEYCKQALNSEVIGIEYVTGFRNALKNLNGEIEFKIEEDTYIQKKGSILYKDNIYKYASNVGGSVTPLIPYDKKKEVFYFKANLISENNIEIFSRNPIDLIEKHNIDLQYIETDFNTKTEYGILFDDKVEDTTWLFLLNEILNYRKNFTKKMSELIHKGLLANQKKLSSEFEKWQNENPNKLEDFSKKFNPILEKLNLEVDVIDTEYCIPIKNKKNDEIIPIQNTSTGTKGLLLSFLPLYKFETKDSIILIDEPERSLFPDMQMDLMDHYKNLAPEAQFIVATHSPFIAASFEPEERFILYFDNEGKVAVRRGISPIGDDPNDMLFNDFGVNYYNDDVQEKFKEYLELLDKVKSESNKELKKKYLLEASKLGNQYNFILDEKNQERLQ